MRRNAKGFTLIELLVVIAIIGILAAMVFPVFARARESARKAVCLSNIKNIALAFQMYFADNNDTFPPGEHRQEVLDYFVSDPGGSGEDLAADPWCVPQGNPYLRKPVILDEYVKNRDVWNCPSAKMTGGATYMIPYQDWFTYWRVNEGAWGPPADWVGLCNWAWPAGWGGGVTDTVVQGVLATEWGNVSAGGQKPFVQSIAVRADWDVKLVEIDDPVKYTVCADGGSNVQDQNVGNLAYPDICCAECGGIYWDLGWPTIDDPIAGTYTCPSGAYCPECWATHASLPWYRDPDRMSASTRHLGGVNIGYADGHASWLNSRRVLTLYADGELLGTDNYCPGLSRAVYEDWCGGAPPAGAEFLY
jgi:prepilin-type N-terminal cleavage/methylation domain-containing protein/prepilin-type processing-associated H-X9-DG protein